MKSVEYDYLETFLIAILQGVTEFLPISSSGHIVLAQELLGQDLELGLVFNIIVHFGTLGSIVIYFYKDLKFMIISAFQMLREPLRLRENWAEDETRRFNVYVLISMIPAAIVGFTIREQLDSVFANPLGVSMMFLFTGTILYATKFFNEGTRKLNIKNTFVIGLAQAVALIPGVSRSGTTISMGVYLGLNREDIARFTFIMMLPVVAGATLVQILSLGANPVEVAYVPHLLTGFLVSMISGYFALKYLIVLFKSRGIHYFAWYCWAIGLLGLAHFL